MWFWCPTDHMVIVVAATLLLGTNYLLNLALLITVIEYLTEVALTNEILILAHSFQDFSS